MVRRSLSERDRRSSFQTHERVAAIYYVHDEHALVVVRVFAWRA